MKYMPGHFYLVNDAVHMFEYSTTFFGEVYHYFVNVETNDRYAVEDFRTDVKEY